MSYPSLGRCSLVGTLVSLLVLAVLASCYALGLALPDEALVFYPGVICFMALPLQPSVGMVITVWVLALFASSIVYIFASHVVFYIWRWWAKHPPRS